MGKITLPHQKIIELADGIRSSSEIASILKIKSSRGIENFLRRKNLPRRKRGPPSAEKNPAWTGGIVIDRDGYILEYNPNHPNCRKNGYILRHRRIAAEMLGRPLKRREVVDHIDGNTLNNAQENLRIFSSNGLHLKKTRKGKVPVWSIEGRKNFVGRSRKVQKRVDKHHQRKKQGDLRLLQIRRAHDVHDKDPIFLLEKELWLAGKKGPSHREIKSDRNPQVQQLKQDRATYRRG